MQKIHKPKAKILVMLSRSLKESFINLFRNKLVSIATITVITMIVLLFNVLLAINSMAKAEISKLNEKVDLILYLENNVEYHTAKNIVEDLKKVDGVLDAKYTSQKEALQTLSASYPDIDAFFEKFEIENPLPASINVKTTSPAVHNKVQKFIDESRYHDLFGENIATKEHSFMGDVTDNLKRISQMADRILYLVILVAFIGGTLIIGSAIKLTIYARRKEIKIMKLFGVHRTFIRLPYILEGIWYVVIAMLINLAFYLVLAEKLDLVIEVYNYRLFFSELVAGIIIANISSFLASSKHLNARISD